MTRAQNLPEPYSVVEPESLEAFSTGIFGFAATLLIVGITLPEFPTEQAEVRLPGLLMALWPHVTAYILSFLNISSYWKLHNFLFRHIRHIDNRLVFLNTLLLLSATFLPFPTALMGKYGRLPITNFIYGATLTLNYLFLFLTAFYAYKRGLVKSEPPFPVSLLLKKKLALPLIAAVLGTSFSLFYPHLGFLFYTVVVLTHFIPFHHREKTREGVIDQS